VTRYREEFDYILLDAQAGSDAIAKIAMSRDVSDEVILVTEYDPLSAAGLDRLKGLFSDDLSYERTWILVNKLLPEFATTLGEFLEVVRYLSPIPWDADVVRAYARRSLAVDFERGNDYTLAVIQTIKGLVGDDLDAEIDTWLKSRAAAVREPVNLQLRDLEREQEGLIKARARLERQRLRRRTLSTALAVYALVASGVGAYLISVSASIAGAIVAVVGVALGIAAATLVVQQAGDVNARVADVQLSRQEEVIDERLKTLQALADSEPAALIRRGREAGGGPP
jgi:hypothetical protein